MAISDTLYEAAFEIRRYLKDQPTMYAEKKDRICAVLQQMDELRKELDLWGSDEPTGPRASLKDAINSALDATWDTKHAASLIPAKKQ
jgi:hypothetical protein